MASRRKDTSFYSDVAIKAAASQGKANSYAKLQHQASAHQSSTSPPTSIHHTHHQVDEKRSFESPDSLRDVSAVASYRNPHSHGSEERSRESSMLSYRDLVGHEGNGQAFTSSSPEAGGRKSHPTKRRSLQRELLEESIRGAQRFHSNRRLAASSSHSRTSTSNSDASNQEELTRSGKAETLASLAGFEEESDDGEGYTSHRVTSSKSKSLSLKHTAVAANDEDEDHSASDYFAGRSPAFKIGKPTFEPQISSSPPLSASPPINRHSQSLGINRSHSLASSTSQQSASPQPQPFVSPSNAEAHGQRGRAFSQQRAHEEAAMRSKVDSFGNNQNFVVSDVVANPVTRLYREYGDEDDETYDDMRPNRVPAEAERNRLEGQEEVQQPGFDGVARLKELREERERLRLQLEKERNSKPKDVTSGSSKRVAIAVTAEGEVGKDSGQKKTAAPHAKDFGVRRDHLMRMANLDDSDYYHQINAGHSTASVLMNNSNTNYFLSPSSAASPSGIIVSSTQYPERKKEWDAALRTTKSQKGRIEESASLRERRLQDLAVFRHPGLEARLMAIRNKQAFNKEASKARRAERFRLADRPVGADGHLVDKESLMIKHKQKGVMSDDPSMQNVSLVQGKLPISDNDQTPPRGLGLPPKGPAAGTGGSNQHDRTEPIRQHLNSSKFTNLATNTSAASGEGKLRYHKCGAYHANVASSTAPFAIVENNLFIGGHGHGLCPDGIAERLAHVRSKLGGIVSREAMSSLLNADRAFLSSASAPFSSKSLHLFRGGQRVAATAITATDLASGSLLEAAAAISSELNSSYAASSAVTGGDKSGWWQLKNEATTRARSTKQIPSSVNTSVISQSSSIASPSSCKLLKQPKRTTGGTSKVSIAIKAADTRTFHNPTRLSEVNTICLPESSPLSPKLLHSPSTFAALQPPPTSKTHPQLNVAATAISTAADKTGSEPRMLLQAIDVSSPLFRKTSIRYAFDLIGQPRSPSLSAPTLTASRDGVRGNTTSTTTSRNSSAASRHSGKGSSQLRTRSSANSSPSRASVSSNRSNSSAHSTRSDALRSSHRAKTATAKEREKALLTRMSFAHQYSQK